MNRLNPAIYRFAGVTIGRHLSGTVQFAPAMIRRQCNTHKSSAGILRRPAKEDQEGTTQLAGFVSEIFWG